MCMSVEIMTFKFVRYTEVMTKIRYIGVLPYNRSRELHIQDWQAKRRETSITAR